MMWLINSILALIVGCALTGCATGRVAHHILKGDGSYNHVITNPKEWALQQFSDGPISGPDVSDYAKLVLKRGLLQTLADLGADGTKELFLRQACPARVWEVLVFRPIKGGYRYLGHFPAGTIVLKDEHASVLVYEPCGGHYGYIKTYRYNGEKFVCTAAQDITGGDGAPEENNQKMARLFPKDKVIRWAKTPNRRQDG